MLCIRDFEEYAKNHLDYKSWAFYSQGAEREVTLRENLRSFTRFLLIPRMLRNVAQRDLSVTVLGDRISLPIGIAPSAYQRLAHPDGEIAAAKAASEVGTIYTLSTVATTSLEDVAKCSSRSSPLWMQIYMFQDRTAVEELIRRTELNGYRALVLTVDTPVVGNQLRLPRKDMTLPPHLSVPNVYPAYKEDFDKKNRFNEITRGNLFEENLTWDDVVWIKNISKLPLILKGILSVEDARLAVQYGVSAVWVSNHGGRQLDGVPSAIEVLPEISSVLSGSGCEIYVDGGFRWGSDVLKALALGARMVFLGRPVLWGLSHSGQDGVRSVLEILKSELDKAMHLSGCKDIQDIGPQLIRRRRSAKL